MASIHTKWSMMTVILVLGISVLAKPTCRTRFLTEIVCVAGTDDYILKRGLVSDNNYIIAITLKDCRITHVDQDAFKNLYKLNEIDLSGNKIRNLEEGVFDGLNNLKSLRLSKNLLTSLPLKIFDNMQSLERLDISDNKINMLELGIFSHLPKLIRLELSGMSFLGKDLDPFLFSHNPKIQYLRMSHNNMSEAPDNLLSPVQQLKVLALNNCSLTEVPRFITDNKLKTLEQLYMQYNPIRRLDDPITFENLENLTTLFLTLNMIESFNENVFKSMPKINNIDLSYNKIVQIPENLFSNIVSLENLELSNNLIERVPVNAFRGTRLKTLNLNANKITYLDNNFLLELRNSRTRLTTFHFIDNIFQCACLLEILKEVKKFDVAYNSDKYNGDEPVCFMTDQFTCMRHNNFKFDYPIDMYLEKTKIGVKV